MARRLLPAFPLQRTQEVENVLFFLDFQFIESIDNFVSFAALALVSFYRLEQIVGTSVMKEKDALACTPKWRCAELIRSCAPLRDTVRQSLTHVVDQKIGKQVHRLI